MTKTYKVLQNAFMERTDCLCEDVLPALCDCNNCPGRTMCEILCSVSPDEEIPQIWFEQAMNTII